jgi:hypothetical protein
MGQTENKSDVIYHSFAHIWFSVSFSATFHRVATPSIACTVEHSRMTSVSSAFSNKDLPYDFCVKGCENCVSQRKVCEEWKETHRNTNLT